MKETLYWLKLIAEPLFYNLSNQSLKIRLSEMENKNRDRLPFAPLEAFDRLMAGISPWLELGPDKTDGAFYRFSHYWISLISRLSYRCFSSIDCN